MKNNIESHLFSFYSRPDVDVEYSCFYFCLFSWDGFCFHFMYNLQIFLISCCFVRVHPRLIDCRDDYSTNRVQDNFPSFRENVSEEKEILNLSNSRIEFIFAFSSLPHAKISEKKATNLLRISIFL